MISAGLSSERTERVAERRPRARRRPSPVRARATGCRQMPAGSDGMGFERVAGSFDVSGPYTWADPTQAERVRATNARAKSVVDRPKERFKVDASFVPPADVIVADRRPAVKRESGRWRQSMRGKVPQRARDLVPPGGTDNNKVGGNVILPARGLVCLDGPWSASYVWQVGLGPGGISRPRIKGSAICSIARTCPQISLRKSGIGCGKCGRNPLGRPMRRRPRPSVAR
jgi:hypothetical protein